MPDGRRDSDTLEQLFLGDVHMVYCRIAVKLINHYGDEVLKVYEVG